MFIELANNYHLTIKFTAETLDTEIALLDTCDVRTHFKLTETFQYTHFTSCLLQASGKALSKAKP